jgi:pilus assembly protein Flp/PilA
LQEVAHMRTLVTRFLKDESGATAIEYGLIAALIAVAIIGGARTLGTRIGGTFNNVSNAIK